MDTSTTYSCCLDRARWFKAQVPRPGKNNRRAEPHITSLRHRESILSISGTVLSFLCHRSSMRPIGPYHVSAWIDADVPVTTSLPDPSLRRFLLSRSECPSINSWVVLLSTILNYAPRAQKKIYRRPPVVTKNRKIADNGGWCNKALIQELVNAICYQRTLFGQWANRNFARLKAGELVDGLEDLVKLHRLLELLRLDLVELVQGKLELWGEARTKRNVDRGARNKNHKKRTDSNNTMNTRRECTCV